MDTKRDILNALNQQANKLSQMFSVSRIGLFGSFARGVPNENSDVDILVELKEPTFDHYMDLKFYLQNLFGRDVDLVMADTVKPRIEPVIEREVVYVEGL